MQMENRMNKTPDIPYFPIADGAPLTDYAAIDKTTVFEVDKEGNVVIYFCAGTVTDEANGGQSFRIPIIFFIPWKIFPSTAERSFRFSAAFQSILPLCSQRESPDLSASSLYPQSFN